MSRIALLAALPVLIACSASEETSFPLRFQGHWTDDLAACGGEDTRGIVITSDHLDYYDGKGRLLSLDHISDDAAQAEIAFEGEGEKWRETVKLSLKGDGRSIEAFMLGQNSTLQRCES